MILVELVSIIDGSVLRRDVVELAAPQTPTTSCTSSDKMSYPAPSSLQQAVSSAQISTKNGAFESSFAGGLDLSEFGATAFSASSASAALLKVKVMEAQERQKEEIAESQMQSIVQSRVKEINESKGPTRDDIRHVAKPSTSNDSTSLLAARGSLVNAALIHVHADEKRDPRTKINRRKDTKSPKGVSKRAQKRKH